jgi:hypothetical protein
VEDDDSADAKSFGGQDRIAEAARMILNTLHQLIVADRVAELDRSARRQVRPPRSPRTIR